MEKPSPKNWNQDFVLTMPEREGFAGAAEGSTEEWASGYCSGAKETTKIELILRIKRLLGVVVRVGVGLWFAEEREEGVVLGIEGLGFGG